jgi:predicted CXXCH cytochrome family protein
MRKQRLRRQTGFPLLCGLIVGLLGLLLTVQLSAAATPTPTPSPNPSQGEGDLQGDVVKECQECHLDVARHWSASPHAHAFDGDTFQERWTGLGEPGECLVCHTTGYQPSTGAFAAAGIQCQGCHGEATADHPPAPVPIRADTEYCGVCHTTTLSEWRLSGHAASAVGCADCHDPHSQQALFAEPDELCLNCHAEALEEHADDIHLTKGVGCVACHALTLPPDVTPVDGIKPTGHTFTISATTCVACHTDTLHAGSALPGYEHGAAGQAEETAGTPAGQTEEVAATPGDPLSAEQRLQAVEAALASRNLSLLFQGAVVGLVLGGTTAWFVSQNARRAAEEDQDDQEERHDRAE